MSLKKKLALGVAAIAGAILLTGCAADNNSLQGLTGSPVPTLTPSPSAQNSQYDDAQVQKDLDSLDKNLQDIDKANLDITNGLNDQPVDLNTK
jgi:hypothetical protein